MRTWPKAYGIVVCMNEDNQQPQPTITPNEVPAPSPAADVAPPAPSVGNEPPRSHKKHTMLLIVLLIVLIGAAVAVFFLVRPKNNETANQTSTQQTETSTVQPNGDITTAFTAGTTTISAAHPADWEVINEENSKDGQVLRSVAIKSPDGHYLRFATNAGVGGDCPDNTYSYTLTQKLPTASPNIFFTEYTTTAPDYPIKYFAIQDFSKNQPGNTTKNVGDTATNVCTLPAYPIVGGPGSENGIYVTISKTAERRQGERLTYADISSDTAFLKMLESIQVVVN